MKNEKGRYRIDIQCLLWQLMVKSTVKKRKRKSTTKMKENQNDMQMEAIKTKDAHLQNKKNTKNTKRIIGNRK